MQVYRIPASVSWRAPVQAYSGFKKTNLQKYKMISVLYILKEIPSYPNVAPVISGDRYYTSASEGSEGIKSTYFERGIIKAGS